MNYSMKNIVKSWKDVVSVILPIYALGCTAPTAVRGEAGKTAVAADQTVETMDASALEVCESIIRKPGYEKAFSDRPACIRGREDVYVGILRFLNKEEFGYVNHDGQEEFIKLAYPVDSLHEEAVKLSADYRQALPQADKDKYGIVERGVEAKTLVALLNKMKPVREKNIDGAFPLAELQFGRANRQ